jgi:hypothetical protein
MPSIINATTSTGLVSSADNSGSLQLATNNGTTAVTITTAQNVGVGTASPLGKFDVGGASTAASNTGVYVHGTDNASYGQFVAFRRNGSNSLIMGDAGAILGSGGGASVFYTYGANYQAFWTNGTERMRITSDGLLQFNSGYGSVATAYGCRAWVNFNASNGSVNGNGNISSVTRNGTGDYTVNFTNSMPDANYCVTTAIKPASNQSSTNGKVANVRFDANLATSSVRLWCNTTAGVEDFDKIFVAIFR